MSGAGWDAKEFGYALAFLSPCHRGLWDQIIFCATILTDSAFHASGTTSLNLIPSLCKFNYGYCVPVCISRKLWKFCKIIKSCLFQVLLHQFDTDLWKSWLFFLRTGMLLVFVFFNVFPICAMNVYLHDLESWLKWEPFSGGNYGYM